MNSAYPIIKKLFDPSENLKSILPQSNNSEYYQGSLILQVPDKSDDNLFFNVFNNFVFNNSTILQMMQGNNGQVSTKAINNQQIEGKITKSLFSFVFKINYFI